MLDYFSLRASMNDETASHYSNISVVRSRVICTNQQRLNVECAAFVLRVFVVIVLIGQNNTCLDTDGLHACWSTMISRLVQ